MSLGYTLTAAFSAVSFLDLNTGIGGFIAIDDYTRRDPSAQRIPQPTALPLIGKPSALDTSSQNKDS